MKWIALQRNTTVGITLESILPTQVSDTDIYEKMREKYNEDYPELFV